LSTIFYILDIFPGTALYEDYQQRHQATDDVWCQRIEDIMYFETDDQLSRDDVLAYGRLLRTTFYENLGQYIKAVELIDDKAFYPLHADFFSRLGMTFSHGDYANIDAVPDKPGIATYCYERALEYYPDLRAFLGLGIIRQKKGDLHGSNKVLALGLAQFPDEAQFHVCMGINHLNLQSYEEALDHLLPFRASPDALPYIVACYREMGRADKAEQYARKLSSLTK
jgi:tetratricopeptide (TPR) repeat protein